MLTIAKNVKAVAAADNNEAIAMSSKALSRTVKKSI
jgi:hypothetical protein